MVRPVPRPSELKGVTRKVATPMGPMYVTINHLNGKPIEVFAQIGRAGSDSAAFTEAIARLISLALRSGVELDDVVKQLSGIGGARQGGPGGGARSVPDALARVLAEFKVADPAV